MRHFLIFAFLLVASISYSQDKKITHKFRSVQAMTVFLDEKTRDFQLSTEWEDSVVSVIWESTDKKLSIALSKPEYFEIISATTRTEDASIKGSIWLKMQAKSSSGEKCNIRFWFPAVENLSTHATHMYIDYQDRVYIYRLELLKK